MTRQQESPIVFLGDSRAPRPSPWRKFLQLKEQDRLQHLKRMVKFQQPPNQEEEQMTWSWRNLLNSIFGQENKKKCENGKSPDSFNIYDRRPNFRNNYGWITAIDESDYQPLRHSGIGVCLVNLTAVIVLVQSLVSAHSTEYGIVLSGSSRIQIVFPNGTQVMNARVKAGDAFWVPRYFPFCQIAAKSGSLEFFGFTTSARQNRPQLLIGASSILQTMRIPELAAACVSEERVKRVDRYDTARGCYIAFSNCSTTR
ncbi:vicilin-like seed storage protein At2g28490 [Populus trichocarpa]|uniref:vicilin-like seed storage protein At2g28490 n=1 Tax=Populus trichocarpa TaxID=3694 RepID=UPI002277E440|nr:vicilin-like seed storage protein At2g28490 [Populus trichocarpa]